MGLHFLERHLDVPALGVGGNDRLRRPTRVRAEEVLRPVGRLPVFHVHPPHGNQSLTGAPPSALLTTATLRVLSPYQPTTVGRARGRHNLGGLGQALGTLARSPTASRPLRGWFVTHSVRAKLPAIVSHHGGELRMRVRPNAAIRRASLGRSRKDAPEESRTACRGEPSSRRLDSTAGAEAPDPPGGALGPGSARAGRTG